MKTIHNIHIRDPFIGISIPLDSQRLRCVQLLVSWLNAELLVGALNAYLLIALNPDWLIRLYVVHVLQLGRRGARGRRYARCSDDVPLTER